MIYLHKILPMLVSPLFVAFAFIVYGALASRTKIVIATVAVLYAISTPLVSKLFFGMVEGPAVRQDPASIPNVDAIVVLSGMLVDVASVNSILYEWSDPDRFFAGVELFKLGKSPKLVFTGGKLPWNFRGETEGEVLKRFAEMMGIPESKILLTEEAKSTEEEAHAVRKLLSDTNSKIILVTSAFHMKRSLQLFHSQHLFAIPFAVDFKADHRKLTPMDFLPDADALALSNLGIRELMGRAFYWSKLYGNPPVFRGQ